MPPPNLTAVPLNTRSSFLFSFLLLGFTLQTTAGPKLAVVVVVDQLRGDFLERAPRKFKYGLKRLSENSRFYSNARLEHVPTETAPGHAAIMTGKPPGSTGIIGNTWLDRETGKTVEATDDPNFITGPALLEAKTLGDQLKEQVPEARVVSISFKDRAAVLMGGRKADTVVWFDKKSKQFTTSLAYGATPAWLADFNKNNTFKGWTQASQLTDLLTYELVKKAIVENHLGEDELCDLLAVSFSGTDLIGHAFGPDSRQMEAQLQSLDKILGDLIDLVSRKTGGNFVLGLTSDHGVMPVPESAAGKKLGAKRVLLSALQHELEEACQRLFPAPESKWVTATLVPDVYLNRNLIKQKGMDWGHFLIQVQTAWQKNPHVARVYLNNPMIEQDEYGAIYQRSYFPGRSGDLFLRMKPGVLVTQRILGTSHGSPYNDDTHVPLLFYGAGFPAEKIDKPTSNEILAPTLATAMGLIFE